MSAILVESTQQADIVSDTLRKQGVRFGKKALFPGQFYELPGDSEGVIAQGKGEALRFLRVPLNQVGVREVTTDDVAKAIVAGRRQKEEFAKGGTLSRNMAEAVAKANKMMSKEV